ncbi:MAG: AAA family ATPase, partial [Armatimonadetes bacterium]|nr:AAA family ATPase [Armatimonadota bacterium]
MRITRISRLRGFGIFRDFTWPSDLPDFRTYNLIYGWNGSGKTLLSNLLRRLEPNPPVTEGTATVRIGDRDISAQDFDQTAVSIRVFNRKFIAANVFKIGGAKSIYLLGKDNIERQKAVKVLKDFQDLTQTSLDAQQDKYEVARKALDDFCIGEAKLIKGDLRAPDTDFYSNYNKSDFAAKADELSEEL